MKTTAQIGKVLDNYRIVETLGEGGMGVVYKAVHTKLDKVVAIKMIAPGLAMNSKFIRRFQTEARALAKLQNPNIVTIHDLRSFEGQWFIVMEYVQGIDIYDLVAKNGAFSWPESIRIVKQILYAVGHAHQAGIIHRDLKPHNIMLTKDKIVKITDFGLAKDESSQMHTMTVASGGTLNYMSPEHVKGFSYIEKRSDLYCVGIILYEMVTGEVPFKNLDSDFDIRESILRRNFDTPTSINAKVPNKLSTIIMKSIEKDPEDRFQSAEEMLSAIDDFLRGTTLKFKEKKPASSIKSKIIKISAAVVTFLFILAAVFGYYSGYFNFDNAPKDEQVEKAPVMANISVNTSPENVSLYINNDLIAQTPLKAHALALGSYNLRLTKDNFQTLDTNIVIKEAANQVFSFSLKPEILEEKPVAKRIAKKPTSTREVKVYSTLLLNSNPSGATVYINNSLRGKTPMTLSQLNAGNYSVRLEHSGYKTYSNSIYLNKGESQNISADLAAIAGNIRINTSTENSVLTMDGKKYTIAGTSLELNNIPVGTKKIKITKSGFSEYNDEITVTESNTVTINATLNQESGKLVVKIRPWGTVYIDNELKKSSADTKYETELPAKTHRLKVEHPTLGFWEKDIKINKNNTTEITINFNKKVPITISAFKENGEPFAGDIYVNNKFIGSTTPQEVKLQIGVHKIKVVKSGYVAADGDREVLVEESSKEPVVFILKQVN